MIFDLEKTSLSPPWNPVLMRFRARLRAPRYVIQQFTHVHTCHGILLSFANLPQQSWITKHNEMIKLLSEFSAHIQDQAKVCNNTCIRTSHQKI